MRARTAILVLLPLLLLTSPAMARGGHGGGMHMHGGGPGQARGVDRHGDEAYLKAVSEEKDRLLTNKLKSICRGC